MKLLKKYRSLSGQAEDIDTHESYKELIETIREFDYGDLYNLIRDTETALTVIARNEAKGVEPGIDVLLEKIVNLGNYCLETQFNYTPDKPRIRYTYEFIEQKETTK